MALALGNGPDSRSRSPRTEEPCRLADSATGRNAGGRARPSLHVVGGIAAADLDRRLLEMSGRAARCRFLEGRIAKPLLARRGWAALGFARLSDYSRERLGIGARSLEESVHVVTALEVLPLVSAAFLDGSLSWTATRLLTGIATTKDEAKWIEEACNTDARTLATMIREQRSGKGSQIAPPEEPDGEASVRWSVRVTDLGRRMWRAAHELAERTAGSKLSQARVLELVAAEASGNSPGPRNPPPNIATEPAVDSSCDTPTVGGTGRCRRDGDTTRAGRDWRTGLETRDPEHAAFLAQVEREPARVEKQSHAESSVAECAAPTTSSAYDWREGLAERDPELAALLAEIDIDDARRGAVHVSGSFGRLPDEIDGVRESAADAPRSFHQLLADVAATESLAWLVPSAPGDTAGPSAWLDMHMHELESADPFVVDERLREVRLRRQRIDFELASLLREAARCRLYRDLRFASLESYVESRLGICSRTAWTLLAIERVASRTSPRLAEAWRDGCISTMAAHAILRVLGHGNDERWIARAREITLRRLEAEVDWALARLAEGGTGEPPAEGLDLAADRLAGVAAGELQMRAHPGPAEEGTPRSAGGAPGAQIAFFAPQSVCELADSVMHALRAGSEPRGIAFERMLALALLEWSSAPPHRDPVFERDGWHCAVPGCTSRRNLHDHHIVFRSLGGDDARDNRITVCATHHLHGLHRGRIRASGRAPGEVTWEMGIRFGPGGGKPLFRTLGDRYV